MLFAINLKCLVPKKNMPPRDMMIQLALTAREILQLISNETGVPYRNIAIKVNDAMLEGKDLRQAIRAIAEEFKLDPDEYRLSATKIVAEAKRILREDYTQTLMMSAVMARMVEAKGKDRLPVPAFLSFLELLNEVEQPIKDTKCETSDDIDLATTRMIELLTTLVSLICKWSRDGIVGVADDCPVSLKEMARTIYRKIRLLQAGLWACISCGKIVNVKTTRALMCPECDQQLAHEHESDHFCEKCDETTFDRTGYGQTSPSK